MKCRSIFSILLVFVTINSYCQDTNRNFVGLELMKPVSLYLFNISNQKSIYSLELSYSRKLSNHFYLRNIGGFAWYNDPHSENGDEYHSKGGFFKPAMDFRLALKKDRIYFMLSAGGFISINKEKARGVFEGENYGTFYSPYFKSTNVVLGPELAFRVGWKLNSFLYWEFSNRLSIPANRSLSFYTAGVSNSFGVELPIGFDVDGKIIIGF